MFLDNILVFVEQNQMFLASIDIFMVSKHFISILGT